MKVRQYTYCRRSGCRTKLPSPTETPSKAFCSKECVRRHHLHHCVNCDKETKPRSPDARSQGLEPRTLPGGAFDTMTPRLKKALARDQLPSGVAKQIDARSPQAKDSLRKYLSKDVAGETDLRSHAID